jgi:galactose mutarotase-like enzyme
MPPIDRHAPHPPHRPILPTGEQHELRHGDQRAVVTEVGAGLRLYQVAGRDVLDTFGPGEMPSGGRGQVLLPWPNRIAGGHYTFADQGHQLPISEPRHGNASHGLTRWQPWRLVERTAARVALGLTIYPQTGYPFALALELAYALADTGLTVSTTARNVGGGPLPFGAGYHPYFTVGTDRIDAALLHLPAATRLVTDERLIPTGRESVADTPYDFRTPRPIGDLALDACYTDLHPDPDGATRITLAHPDGAPRLILTLDAHYRFAQIYSGDNLPDPAARRRGLAIEPMTCPANAFNSGDGLIVLQPGESFSATWNVRVA